MSLATRVIPILLHRGTTLVKGERFNGWRSVGHALQAARIHNSRAVDELIMLDIGATPEGRRPDAKMVEALARDCFVPLTVGGGVRRLQDVQDLLNAGADKVAICTGARETPILQAAAERFGSQAIVAALDVKWGSAWTHCGTTNTYVDYDWVADRFMRYGAGEILLTSIEREGTMQGYDLELIKAVSADVDIPVIANGGCSGPEDMLAAVRAGASAVAAGALFQFTDTTPREASQYLLEHGIEARIA